jgi:tetratricopeptide (TPR) repeat protein
MVKRIMLSVGMVLFSVVTVVMQGQGLCQGTGNPVPPLPKQPKEVEEQVKRAYALFEQGQYEAALSVALKVHQQHGNVMVCWYPRWVLQYAKGNLPDPYDKGSILRATVEGSGLPIPASMAVRAKSVRVLIAQIYEEIGDYKEAIKWYERVGPKLGEKTVGPGIHVSHMGIIRCMQKLNQGYRPPQPPPKNTWRPLPLKFREEDYFILVPLDQACKVLGIAHRLDVSPKTKRVRYVFLGEKGKLYPGLTQAKDLSGRQDFLAYAPYEEGGVVWVPFYWLAKQAGIRWWEVRDGKIYVAPK